MATLRKTSDHILYKDPRFYASFPAVATAADGTIVVIFRRGRDTRSLFRGSTNPEVTAMADRVDHLDARSQLVQLRLDAKLRPVESPRPLEADPEAADQDASLLRLHDDSLLLASFSWYPVAAALRPALDMERIAFLGRTRKTGALFVYWGSSVRRSHDSGATWTPHDYLPAHSLTRSARRRRVSDSLRRLPGSPVRGQALETKSGILLAAYDGGDSLLYASQDSGASFAGLSVIARHEKGVRYVEPALLQRNDGVLVAFMRTSGADDRLATAESLDGGATWQPARVRAVVGHPYHPLRLADGRVLLTYGYRHSPQGVRARLLDPACSNIDTATELILRDDGTCSDVGYPWATLLPNGRVLVVYYFVGSDSVRHIAASILDVKRLI